MAQLVRAPPCHGGGRGFESHSGRLQETLSVDCLIKLSWDHSSAGRASALQAEGHRFEPYRPHIPKDMLKRCADVAQLAEQLICNQQVIGSSPIIGLHQTVNLNDVCWKTVKLHMGGFPSGQRGQTVNLLQFASVVRIHLRPLHI